MKITLISLTEDVFIPSLRCLSAYLRAQGHETTLVLLPWEYTDKRLGAGNSFLYPYTEDILEQVAVKCDGADLVGLSLMTCHFDLAVQTTRFLRRKTSAPIIWGGMHPTIRPAECLQYADMACVGEGEVSVSQLAGEMDAGKSWESLSIPGIYKRGQKLEAEVEPSPIVLNLDDIPLPDFDLDHQFLLYEGKLVELTGPLLAKCAWYGYQVMFSRGCPYSCTYCCNNALRTLYRRKLPLRWRSVGKRIEELKRALKLMPELQAISIADDAFLAQPVEDLKEFTAQYREHIKLPFSILTTPRSVSEQKLAGLAEAGLYTVAIGIQSGSPRIYRALYSRPETLDEIVSASHRIKSVARKMNRQIVGRYDMILDNPWETAEDVAASVRLCMQLERPFNLATFSLTLYPGTELYERARKEGRITDDLNQVYRYSQLVVQKTYLNAVFAAVSSNAPKWLVLMLLGKPMQRWCPRRVPLLIAGFFELVKYARGFVGYARRGEWTVIRFLFRMAWARISAPFKPKVKQDERPKFAGPPGETRASARAPARPRDPEQKIEVADGVAAG